MKTSKKIKNSLASKIMSVFLPPPPPIDPRAEHNLASFKHEKQRKGFRSHNPAGSKIARECRENRLGVKNA